MLLSRQNRLLPILAIVVGLLFLLVLQRACRQSTPDSVLLEAVPQVSSPDADTPTDTLNTLTATVAAMTAELEQLRDDNAGLRDINQALLSERQTTNEQVRVQVEDAMAIVRQDSGRSAALADLQRRLDDMSERLSNAGLADPSDLPIGFGLTANEAGNETIWIAPLDADARATPNATTRTAETTLRGDRQTHGIQEVLTVPRNATLMGSTAMTALLGRVPIRGEVRDPMPFKIITGRDNLAANGFTVPGIAGMVWSGTAIGDWTLSCVSGQLHSVTYVFADGSIRTISSDEGSTREGNGKRNLGWISDDRGVPCVSGERKSNAAAFLSQRVGAKAFEAAAEAAAAAQTTTVLRDNGGTTNAVTGDSGDFVLGKTLANGGAEVAAWLAERQANAFDAVFVRAGTPIVIHVDRELAIDLDPTGRKLDYEATPTGNTPRRLD